MKKILFWSIALFGTMGCLQSQAQLTAGIKGGANFSTVAVMNKQVIQDGKINSDGILGYNIGIFARVGKIFYVQPEVYLSSQGSKFVYQPENGDTPENIESKFTVVNVPVLIGKSIDLSGFNLRFNAGPVATILLNKNEKLGEQFKQAYSDFNEYKNTTIGVQAGAGVDIGNITLDARYEAGLQKLNEKYGQRQNLFNFSVGFKFL